MLRYDVRSAVGVLEFALIHPAFRAPRLCIEGSVIHMQQNNRFPRTGQSFARKFCVSYKHSEY